VPISTEADDRAVAHLAESDALSPCERALCRRAFSSEQGRWPSGDNDTGELATVVGEMEARLSASYPVVALAVFVVALTLLLTIRSRLSDDTFRDIQWLLAIALIAALPLLNPYFTIMGYEERQNATGGY
jgi:hypothetical protein